MPNAEGLWVKGLHPDREGPGVLGVGASGHSGECLGAQDQLGWACPIICFPLPSMSSEPAHPETEARSSRVGAVSSALCLCFLLPNLHCLPDPSPPSLPQHWLHRQTRVISQEGIWTFLWSGWGAGPHQPGFLFPPVWGQLQPVWGLAGQGGCREG